MERFLVDFPVNMYEAIAVFALMLSMFRFSLKGYLIHTIIAGIVIAQTSYLLRFEFQYDSVTPIFILLWVIIFLWRIFRIHPFYSLLIAVSGYLSYMFIQTILILFLQIWFTQEEILGPFINVKLLQIGSSTLTLGLAYWLLKRRIGFSFVPDRMDDKVEMKGLNLVLLIISITGCFLVSGAAYILLNVSYLLNALGAICMITILVILNLAFKKEMKS